ncbi:helix-turn-helix domain-containing protein [Actinoplanes subglobosus]|uniref:Helix-turn-helix transcriptional regulator n=1 Tax=Actinoplanes subglobosus TaxID=1547892 RepID=A0ABV8IU86_9ACTN
MAGSTIPRRTLGIALRKAREEAGITMTDAATIIGQTVQSLRRIEHGAVSTPKGKVTLLCQRYGVSDNVRTALERLAGETRARGWWHSYGYVVPTWFELYVALEQTADHLRQFAPLVVPGLLQHPLYIDAAITAVEPDLTPDEVTARAAIRRSRQQQVTRTIPDPPRLEVIIAETVLMIEMPAGVMRAQLRHLLVTGDLTHVSVRLLPLSAGLHRASIAGGFVLLDFLPEDGTRPPSTVYCESQTGAVYLDKPREYDTYQQIWASLDEAALDRAESATLISRRLKELNDDER